MSSTVTSVDEEVLDRFSVVRFDPAQRRHTPQELDRGVEPEIQRELTELSHLRAGFQEVVQTSSTGLLVVDDRGEVCIVNPAAAILLRSSAEALIGSDFGVPAVGAFTEMEVHCDGQECSVAEVSAIRTEWNGRAAYLLKLHDVRPGRRAETGARPMAYYDRLTGLPNRQLFTEHLEQALARARLDGTRVAVMFLDLDGFKAVNDTYGHLAGDKLLEAVAERLVVQVGEAGRVACMGGDEFTIMLEGLSNGWDARRSVEQIRAAFVEPFQVADWIHSIGTSIGISLYPEHGADGQTLLKNADTAMYRAKRGERGAFSFYTDEMGRAVAGRLSLEQELRRALDREEFELWYQPQVSLTSGRMVGVEALLRWRHPERGLVQPAEVIPVLEETGLIVPVGEWVLDTACAQISAWDAEGRSVPVAVNVSALQLDRGNLEQFVQTILRLHKLDEGRRLSLELTESAVMKNLEGSMSTLRALKDLGLSLAMDDFGTGYSSLSTLKQLPFDLVKIDMSFIKDIVDNSDDTALTAAIVAMAHKLGKRALAEGVEDKEQADTLLALGCDSAQGWLFGRPVPAAELSFAREEFTPLAIEPDPFCELPAANGGYRRPYRSIRSEIQAWSRDPAGIPSATRCRGTRRAGRMNRPSS